jgi:hypothetical protein
MSIEPSPGDADLPAPAEFKLAPDVWWLLASQLVVVIALVILVLV